MSQYITSQTVADEIGGWARLNDALDDDGDGQVDAGLLDRLIASASGAVDGFLQGRYPFGEGNAASFANGVVTYFCTVVSIEPSYHRKKEEMIELHLAYRPNITP